MKLDRKKIVSDAAKHGRAGARFALKAAIINIVLCFGLAVFGAVGGYHGILWLDWPTWVATIVSMICFFGGALIGIFLGNALIADMLQEMVVDAGLTIGQKGWRAALARLERKEAKAALEKPDGPPEKQIENPPENPTLKP